MATKATSTLTFKVTNITESGPSRVNVGLVQVGENGEVPSTLNTPIYSSNLTLNLTAEEGKAYYPGQLYTVTLAPSNTTT